MRPAATAAPAATAKQPLLVVVDYAERWPLTVLVQLVDNGVFDYPDRQVGVLLLARPQAGFWNDVHAELSRSGADLADPLPLGRFTVTADEGEQAFGQAATAFQAAMELDRRPVTVPGWLTQSEYGSPLTVQMTALAAVCAGHDEMPVPGRDELSAFLLEHERRSGGPQNWVRVCWSGGVRGEPVRTRVLLFRGSFLVVSRTPC